MRGTGVAVELAVEVSGWRMTGMRGAISSLAPVVMMV